MKTILLTGRLTKDPEFSEYTKEGGRSVKRTSFSLAHNEPGKDKAEYFDVIAWGDLAVFLRDRVAKGTLVLLNGTFHMDTYTGKDGKKHNHFVIWPDRVEVLS